MARPLHSSEIVHLFGIAALLSLALVMPALGKDHGFPDSPTKRYMEKLLIPPKYEVSCCGVADGYPVDRYEKQPDGSYLAWIADGSAKDFPDGSHRYPWDVTVPVPIPAERVNREEDDLDNPTDNSVLFMAVRQSLDAEGKEIPSTIANVVYCFVRHPQGS